MGRGAAVTMTSSTSMYETMNPTLATVRYERSQVWGIDCAESLEWRGWEPGGEYVRSLVVKNVSTKVLKVKYKLPATKYFSMEFPEAIKLSPGMSATVDVTFRPIVMEQYDDFIEFTVPGGTFNVKITALLPVVAVEVRAHAMQLSNKHEAPRSPPPPTLRVCCVSASFSATSAAARTRICSTTLSRTALLIVARVLLRCPLTFLPRTTPSVSGSPGAGLWIRRDQGDAPQRFQLHQLRRSTG